MTLTCVGWRLEESGAWSQGCFRADPLVEGNKDPRVYWRVSLAPPDLWALCLHNEICPDQRLIRVAGDDACRFIVTNGLLKRAVSLLHVCSCAVFTAADCYRLTAHCANWLSMLLHGVCVSVMEKGFNYKNKADSESRSWNSVHCCFVWERHMLQAGWTRPGRICVCVAADTVPVKAKPVAGVQMFVSFHSSSHSMPLLALWNCFIVYWKMGAGCDLLSILPTLSAHINLNSKSF